MKFIQIPLDEIEMIQWLLTQTLHMSTRRSRKSHFNKVIRILRDTDKLPAGTTPCFLSHATDLNGDQYLVVGYTTN